MFRWRIEERTLWMLTFVVTLLQATRSECQLFQRDKVSPGAEETVCAVYSLSELGEDPSIGAWAAETLLKLMETGTWKGEGSGRWLLNYHPHARVLVVHHTPAVQAKVDGFLRDLKKAATPVARAASQEVIQAGGTAPAVVRPAEAPYAGQPSYIVPRTLPQPKHLFHFIIRYEGDGISDPGVLDALDVCPGSKSPMIADAVPPAVLQSLAGLSGGAPSMRAVPRAPELLGAPRPMASPE